MDSGLFSPVIGGRGPPDLYDRYGNQIRAAEMRFQIWFDTGEIKCTSNVNQEEEIDKTVGRQKQIVLMDSSNYVKGSSDSKPTSDIKKHQFRWAAVADDNWHRSSNSGHYCVYNIAKKEEVSKASTERTLHNKNGCDYKSWVCHVQQYYSTYFNHHIT
jgi:hypothetical protein